MQYFSYIDDEKKLQIIKHLGKNVASDSTYVYMVDWHKKKREEEIVNRFGFFPLLADHQWPFLKQTNGCPPGASSSFLFKCKERGILKYNMRLSQWLSYKTLQDWVSRDCRGCDHMVGEFTYEIRAYPARVNVYSIQLLCLPMICDSSVILPRVLRFPPSWIILTTIV